MESIYERVKEYPDMQKAVLVRKVHEYGDIYSFVFKPEREVKFIAGQFAHLLLHDMDESKGKPVHDFSIASAPHDGELMFTTHVRKESLYKQKLDSLKEGDSVTLFKIKGEFTLPTHTDKPIVLIAGGIGITPYRSMLRDVYGKEKSYNLMLIHVSDDAFLYEEEFSEYPLSQMRMSRDALASYLEELCEENPDALYYVSGPPGFVDALKDMLTEFDVPEEHIKQDWFDGYEDL